MKISPIIKTVSLVYILLSFAAANNSQATKLYKWVDAQGRISYQDKPPPLDSTILSEKTLKENSSPKPKATKNIRLNKTPVDVYISENCPACDEMLAKLVELNVPYNARNIYKYRNIQSRIVKQTNSLTVPSLFISNNLIEKLSESELKLKLQEEGYIVIQPPENEAPSADEKPSSDKEPSTNRKPSTDKESSTN